jgi:hypothetical protein
MTRSALALALLLTAPSPAAAATPVGWGLGLRLPSVSDALTQIDGLPRRSLQQTFVLPERPGQNRVSWFDFDWRWVDVPPPGGGSGGIRLYYYKTAEAQARRALPAIRSGYARLVAEFSYSPTRRIPFILFATQREFQTQNVFQVTESVLGVTSPQDLKMSVPYFGDHARFVEVATHEMVHQFTIQKLMDAQGGDDLFSPIRYLPLWFIEGIAEYYTKGGIDPETEGFLRDLVWNPDAEKGYQVLDFPEDRARGYLATYKMGQARIAFIAETYGREKVQAFLDNAHILADTTPGPGAVTRGFGALVRRVLDESVEEVDVRWRAWLKRRYFAEYVGVRQDLPSVRELRGLPAEPESFVATPDGTTLLVRGIERKRGRARLDLLDLASPRDSVRVAVDDVPGVESLHPLDYGATAIADGVLAYSARDGIGDTLYLHRWRRVSRGEGRSSRLELGRRRTLAVRPPGGGRFVVISDPAFSSDGSHLAFVGVAGDGQRDVYVVASEGGEARRLTDDFYAERDLAWGPDGLYVSSDATDHGRFNLFRIDVASGARTRLTTAPTDDRHPHPQADGTVLYASEAGGVPNLWLLEKGTIRQVSDFTTGLTAPAPTPKARGILASTFHGGVFRLVELPKLGWLTSPAVAVAPAAGEPLAIPAEPIPGTPEPYEAYRPRNWRPEAGIIYGGGTGSAVAGRAAVLFSDYLRDHVLFLDLSVYGSFDYTQGLLLYENRSGRLSWGLGGFHFVQQQLDRVDPALAFYQRDFGAVGVLRWPLDLFRRVELEVGLGGVERYCLTDFANSIVLVCEGIGTVGGAYQDTAAWERLNGGVHPVVSPTLRLGYDTVRYDPLTGPLDGASLLLEAGGGWLPDKALVHGFARVEASRWWQLAGRANIMFRVAGAMSDAPTAEGRLWERSWWLSSADNLRGFSPFDLGFLIGQNYYVANAELQFPLEPILRLAIFDHIEGVAALDFGGVFNRLESRTSPSGFLEAGAWESRTLTGVLGVNALLGPILLRLHFGHPYDIGGLVTPALARGDRWVTNFTLRYFFF